MYRDILVLEGEWEKHPNKTTSIKAAMHFLQDVTGRKYYHRWIATEDEFFFQLRKARYARFKVVYLAFHGEQNAISLEDSHTTLTLENIVAGAGDSLRNKIIHFGSCSVLNLPVEQLQDFKKRVGARYISGYQKDVDFIDSSLFDLAYFAWLEEYERIGYVDTRLKNEYPGLYERLGFILI